MKIKINEGFLGLKDNYLFSEVARRVRDYGSANPEEEKRLIRLGIGDVTLPLAPCVVAAARRATAEMGESETFRGYAPERGYAFLLEAVARRYASLGVSLDEDEIFISDGAKSDAGNIADILGDSPVYIPDPVYPVYADSSILAGRRVRMIEGTRENLFLPMPDGIAESGAVFFICSPNNPTGAVYSRKQLEKWVDFARETGSLIIYDSAYESFDIRDRRSKTMRGRNMQPVKIGGLHRNAVRMDGRAVRTFSGRCVAERALGEAAGDEIQRRRIYYSACRRSRAFRRGTRAVRGGDTNLQGKRAHSVRAA